MKKENKIQKNLMVLILTFMMVSVWQGKEVQAATDEAKAEVREIIVEMFQAGDTSTRDINDLKLTWKEFDSIYNDVIENECWLEYRCCHNTLYQTTTYKENNINYVSDFYLMGMDPQLPEYTATAREKIEYIESQIDSKMTDLDKLVLIHDYIDRINTYNLNAEHGYIHSATGPLYFGSSVCDGYAKAMNLLLNAVGVETDTISNDGHRWSLVKIDGEYYHVDPTWDDTRCYKTGTYKTHYFMMRNDDEYRNDPYSPHVGFGYHDYVNNVDVTTFSTSTKYTDWYVHSVIGDMYYYDGYWYYVQNDCIMKNNIQGTDCSTVVSGTNITLQGITEGVLTYSMNDEEKTIVLSGNEESENGETEEGENPEGGSTESGSTESGSTESENPESGSTESGSTEGGSTESGSTESGSTESGSTEDGNTEGGSTKGENTQDENTESGKVEDERKESGNTEGENTQSGNVENGSATENDGENLTETGNSNEYKVEDGNNQKGVFKDKKSKSHYRILTKGKKTGTVDYIKPYASAKGKVTIPATIKKNGITYKVVGISANAFKNNKKVTQIIIGKNIKNIGAKAFYNCKKLKTIKINTTKLTSSSVKKTAFKGINKKVTVKVAKSKYSKYKKLLTSKGLKSKSQVKKK
ncbi:MAG: leucine-rich repeat protein [Lachnospiraceae bacterium]|nr:leucine-rich repeat protein [Lachnospiraceae bacterium]